MFPLCHWIPAPNGSDSQEDLNCQGTASYPTCIASGRIFTRSLKQIHWQNHRTGDVLVGTDHPCGMPSIKNKFENPLHIQEKMFVLHLCDGRYQQTRQISWKAKCQKWKETWHTFGKNVRRYPFNFAGAFPVRTSWRKTNLQHRNLCDTLLSTKF